jgi:dipeptidyl aminopeptidase/acylaminoacyl peptidase
MAARDLAPANDPATRAPAAVPTVAPYGSWTSAIPIDALVTGTVRLSSPVFDNGDIYWLEGRPTDGGRQVIVFRRPSGLCVDLTLPGTNARSRVHEYGGGSFAVSASEVVYSEFSDGRIYRVPAGGGEATTLTQEGDFRYGDLTFDPMRDHLLAVREDHSGDGEPVNTIVTVALDESEEPRVLISGSDFISSPRPSPDGTQIAWLTWNHPNMPWDGMDLWQAAIDEDGIMGPPEHVAGSPSEWTTAPAWSPEGVLHYASERSGWLQIYRRVDGRDELVTPIEAEFAKPDWAFGQSSYAFGPDGTLYAVGRADGRDTLWAFPPGGQPRRVDVPFTEIGSFHIERGRAMFLGAGPADFGRIVLLDLATGEIETLRRSSEAAFDPSVVSAPEPVDFTTTDGQIAHGLFYAPKNPSFRGPDGEGPPLVVSSHGGPTAAASSALKVGTQLLTSRGIAVLDVDYGGSTGYGREYRKRLEGTWGVVDVDDCVNGALALADRGLVDRERIAIEGGSASGYTTLCAITFRDTFRAGVSYFGIGDLAALERNTHKFESRYTWRLVAPFAGNEELYRERSPLFFADRIRCPVLILQGLDDRVVPPDQAESMMAALAANHVPRAAIYFEGEDHGFRKAANIIRSFEAELSFYGQVFRFTPADAIEPIVLER